MFLASLVRGRDLVAIRPSWAVGLRLLSMGAGPRGSQAEKEREGQGSYSREQGTGALQQLCQAGVWGTRPSNRRRGPSGLWAKLGHGSSGHRGGHRLQWSPSWGEGGETLWQGGGPRLLLG